MSRLRLRERFNFWLDASKDDEFWLAEQIDELKRKRQFASAIRNGLKLLLDLRAGRIDVLRELFPWVFDAIAGALEEEQNTKAFAIEAQLQRLEKLLIEQGNTPIERTLPAGPKRLDVPQFAVAFNDEEEEVMLEVRADQSTGSAQNFLNSVMAISGPGG